MATLTEEQKVQLVQELAENEEILGDLTSRLDDRMKFLLNPEEVLGKKAVEFGGAALEKGLLLLDAPGGVARLGISKALGKDVTLEDLKKVITLQESAPSTVGAFKEAGFDRGAKTLFEFLQEDVGFAAPGAQEAFGGLIQKGGQGDFTQSEVLGALTDIGSSALSDTLLLGGARRLLPGPKALPKAPQSVDDFSKGVNRQVVPGSKITEGVPEFDRSNIPPDIRDPVSFTPVERPGELPAPVPRDLLGGQDLIEQAPTQPPQIFTGLPKLDETLRIKAAPDEIIIDVGGSSRRVKKEQIHDAIFEEVERRGPAPQLSPEALDRGFVDPDEIFDLNDEVDDLVKKGVFKTVGEGLEFLMKPVSTTLSAAGKNLFRAGIIDLEWIGQKFGKEEVSEFLFRNKIVAKESQIPVKIQALKTGLLKERAKILAEADLKAGKNPNLQGDIMAPIISFVQKVEPEVGLGIKRENVNKLTDELFDLYSRKTIRGENSSVPPSFLSRAKTQVGENFPANLFNKDAKDPQMKRLQKKLYASFRQEAELAVETATGRGEEFKLLNDKISIIRAIEKEADKMAKSGVKRPFTNLKDWAIGASIAIPAFGRGGAGGTIVGAGAIAFPIVSGTAKSKLFQTGVGSMLRKAGEGPISGPTLDATLKQAIIELKRRADEEKK